MAFNLLTTANAKVAKSVEFGYLNFILHLAPADLSGYNTCPKASEGCKTACLNTAGRGGMFKAGENTNFIQQARIRKTKMFFEQRDMFMALLRVDIMLAIAQAKKENLIPCIRLNGTSDLSWHKYTFENGNNVFQEFPGVQFYDYTAIVNPNALRYQNYHLTFSAKENNDTDILKAAALGMNIAVVFDHVPETYMGRKVINADLNDLRFLDDKNVICGLKAKGRAKKDNTGFVRKMIPILAV